MTASAPLLSSLVPTAPGTRVTIEETVRQIHEEVVVVPRSTGQHHSTANAAPVNPVTDLLVAQDQWGWEELRDYVIRKIAEIHGPTPRQQYKEQAIFTAFLKRHPARGAQIARYAFEVAGGYWKNAPISVNRFCAASDAYFADLISARLCDVEQASSARI